MYTTDGSSFLASLVNSLPSCTAFGTTSGEASGEPPCPRAAWTPVLTSVPMTIPIVRVTSRRLKDSNFCCRITLYHRMALVTPFFGQVKRTLVPTISESAERVRVLMLKDVAQG